VTDPGCPLGLAQLFRTKGPIQVLLIYYLHSPQCAASTNYLICLEFVITITITITIISRVGSYGPQGHSIR